MDNHVRLTVPQIEAIASEIQRQNGQAVIEHGPHAASIVDALITVTSGSPVLVAAQPVHVMPSTKSALADEFEVDVDGKVTR